MRHRVMVALAASAVSVSALAARQPPTFRAETRLVVLQVTVRDGRDVPVTNLTRDAFTVYENGKRQPIALFRSDDVPVSIGLVVDNSGSMRSIRSNVETAALAFARASNPLDELFVANFADRVHLDVGFTSDPSVLERGLARVDAIGGTALYDALDTAQRYLAANSHRDRRALVVITDANDNASETTMAAVEQQAERADTVIYAVGLFGGDASKAKKGRHDLDRVTARTGGVALYPTSADQIEPAVLELAHDIRQQYTIGYTPLDQALDGTYRKIRVAVASRERLVIRTRPGYWAARTG